MSALCQTPRERGRGPRVVRGDGTPASAPARPRPPPCLRPEGQPRLGLGPGAGARCRLRTSCPLDGTEASPGLKGHPLRAVPPEQRAPDRARLSCPDASRAPVGSPGGQTGTNTQTLAAAVPAVGTSGRPPSSHPDCSGPYFSANTPIGGNSPSLLSPFTWRIFSRPDHQVPVPRTGPRGAQGQGSPLLSHTRPASPVSPGPDSQLRYKWSKRLWSKKVTDSKFRTT